MKPVRFHQLARAELDEAIGYYERQQSGLGLDLQSELETVINRIQRNPEIGAR